MIFIGLLVSLKEIIIDVLNLVFLTRVEFPKISFSCRLYDFLWIDVIFYFFKINYSSFDGIYSFRLQFPDIWV